MLTSLYYLIAAVLWCVVYLSGRAIVRRFRSRKYFAGVWFIGLTTFLLWAGLELRMLPGSTAYRDCYYSNQWFGRIGLLGNLRLYYHSEREFNGDGYSIDVFDISDSFAAWAASPPAEFTIRYPIKPEFRSHWNSIAWHKTPIPAEEVPFLDTAMSERADDPKLEAAIKLLKKLANEPGNYIAIRYHGQAASVADIDFFLLSPSEKTFILVNFNT